MQKVRWKASKFGNDSRAGILHSAAEIATAIMRFFGSKLFLVIADQNIDAIVKREGRSHPCLFVSDHCSLRRFALLAQVCKSFVLK